MILRYDISLNVTNIRVGKSVTFRGVQFEHEDCSTGLN